MRAINLCPNYSTHMYDTWKGAIHHCSQCLLYVTKYSYFTCSIAVAAKAFNQKVKTRYKFTIVHGDNDNEN